MRRMDAAVAMDAKTASTATWKTAQNAVSHSAHPHYSLHALHTKNLTLPSQYSFRVHLCSSSVTNDPCSSVFIRGGMIRVIRVHPWLVLLCVHPWNNSRLSVVYEQRSVDLGSFYRGPVATLPAQLSTDRHRGEPRKNTDEHGPRKTTTTEKYTTTEEHGLTRIVGNSILFVWECQIFCCAGRVKSNAG